MTAEDIKKYMEHRVQAIGKEYVQDLADELEGELKELTPKRTGRTAASWTQEKQEDGSIVIHTRLKTKKGFQPARWLLELNYGNKDQPPTMFIQRAIAKAQAKFRRGG